MPITRRFSKTVDTISDFVGEVAVYLVLITVVIGVYNVGARFIGRYLGLQLSSNRFIELQWYLFSLVFFLGFAYIMQHGINVRVDFIYSKWSLKRRAKLDFWLNWIMILPFCVIGVVETWDPLLTSWGLDASGHWCFAGSRPATSGQLILYFVDFLDLRGAYCGEISPDPDGLNRAPIKSFILLAFALLALQVLAEQAKLFRVLRHGEDVAGGELQEAEAPLRLE